MDSVTGDHFKILSNLICCAFLLYRVEGLMDSYTQGFERSYTVNSSILHGIEPRLKDFHQLLLSPPKVGHLGLPQEQIAPGLPFRVSLSLYTGFLDIF